MPTTGPMGPDGFQAITHVSRETRERLTLYAELLIKWQGSVNLVGKATLGDLWRRHMLDSAQLFPLVPTSCQRLLDLGSGAGFPGLVLAILGVRGVELVESDQKKAVFLREVARQTGTSVIVHDCRVDMLEATPADVVTARALAPLDRLIPMVARFMGPDSSALLPKGAEVDRELDVVCRVWHLWYRCHTSLSDTCSTILEINRMWYETPK